ncbi:signal peptide peptidase SppA [Candidatus Micrarchaeota archaeon CG08_land_8_20_14_0_20_59_11]|nr:MAG: signal peptide peptidase SppA [Candidatus Micrarchaeota archaeon CG08_land_8_20_14_0_20_59_11]
MKLSRPLVSLLGVFALALLLIILVADSGLGIGGGECVGVVRIAGDMTYEKGGVLAGGGVTAQGITEEMARANADSSVKAILVEINSGGGSAAAGKEIYDAIAASGKPTVAYLEEMAASGGYYAASATDYIVANPNTITGNIGAKMDMVNYEGLFEKLGLRADTIKQGEMKDIGSPTRNMTPEERALLQRIIDESYGNFRKDLEAGRSGKLTAQYEESKDARLLSPRMALEMGLIDEIANRERALNKTRELGGMTATEICDMAPPKTFADVLSELGASIGSGIASSLANEGTRLDYK